MLISLEWWMWAADRGSTSGGPEPHRVGVKYSTCTCTWYLASNFQVLFIKKCKSG